MQPASFTPETIAEIDAAIVLTDHDDIDLTPLDGADLVVLDTKNALQGSNIERL